MEVKVWGLRFSFKNLTFLKTLFLKVEIVNFQPLVFPSGIISQTKTPPCIAFVPTYLPRYTVRVELAVNHRRTGEHEMYVRERTALFTGNM